MNQYEAAVLYHPDLEIDLEKAANKVVKCSPITVVR